MRFFYNIVLLGLYGQATLASKRKCHFTSRSARSELATGSEDPTSSAVISVSSDTVIPSLTLAATTSIITGSHASDGSTIINVVSTAQRFDTASISSISGTASSSSPTITSNTASTSNTATTSSTATTSGSTLSSSESTTASSTDPSTGTSTQTTTQTPSSAIESGSSSTSDGTTSSTTTSAVPMCTEYSIQLQGSPSNGMYFGDPVTDHVLIAKSANTVEYYLKDGNLMLHTSSTSSDQILYSQASYAISGLHPIQAGSVGGLAGDAMPVSCTREVSGKLTCSSGGLNTFYTCTYGAYLSVVMLSATDNTYLSQLGCSIASLYSVGTGDVFPC